VDRLLRRFAILLFVIGTVARAWPVVLGGDWLRWSYPTEDGYLMLTIARNIALGHGMSVSEGLVATNGVQPLVATVQAGLFWIAGGDREVGLRLVMALAVLVAMGTAWLASRVMRSYVPATEKRLADVVAMLWYASPLAVQHTMNGLETGAALAVTWGVVLTANRLVVAEQSGRPRRAIVLGVLLAAAFWTRNDAVLLGCAVTVAWLAVARARIRELLIAGVVGILLASPWVMHNVRGFGHLIPVSGRAQALVENPLGGWPAMVTALAEYGLVVVPIPGVLERNPAVVIVTMGLVAALAIALVWLMRRDLARRFLYLAPALFLAALVVHYLLGSTAHYFYARYLFPISLLLAVVPSVTLLLPLWRRRRLVAVTLLVAAAVTTSLLDARLVRRADGNDYRQLVAWVDDHVPHDVWIGAPQSGTLGFFHDRTVNLDGKVDPEALAAITTGNLDRYAASAMTADGGITYLVGWSDLGSWVRVHGLDGEFALHLIDARRNIAVFARRGSQHGGGAASSGAAPDRLH
jgi:hypothetical protein